MVAGHKKEAKMHPVAFDAILPPDATTWITQNAFSVSFYNVFSNVSHVLKNTEEAYKHHLEK